MSRQQIIEDKDFHYILTTNSQGRKIYRPLSEVVDKKLIDGTDLLNRVDPLQLTAIFAYDSPRKMVHIVYGEGEHQKWDYWTPEYGWNSRRQKYLITHTTKAQSNIIPEPQSSRSIYMANAAGKVVNIIRSVLKPKRKKQE